MQRLRFDLIDLRLFISIADANSLTRGAEHCCMSLAAASMRIKNLENSLETKLFCRNRQGVTLTPAGQAMLHNALLILRQTERLQGDLLEYAKGVKGRIRIFANTTAMTEFLPAALGAYLSDHPQVDVDLEERMSNDIVRAVLEGSIDLGIVAGTVRTDGLDVLPYHRDRLVLACPMNHPLAKFDQVAFEDVLNYEFVSLHSGSAIFAFVKQVASELGVTLPVRVQVSSFDALCRMVEAGAGIGVLQHAAAKRLAKVTNIHVVELTDEWAERELKICTQKLSELPSFARELVDYLVSTVPVR